MRMLRAALAALVLVAAAAAIVFFVFPEALLHLAVERARASAGREHGEADANGDRIAYLDGGAGEVVVLLHGFGASKDNWNALAGRLASRYRVIAPDVRGFGESPFREDARYDPVSQARVLHDFLVALGVAEHHLGGLSMGGEIAAAYAATYPTTVRSLLVIGAPGVRAPQRTDVVRRMLAGEPVIVVRTEDDLAALLAMASAHPRTIPGPFARAISRRMAVRAEIETRILADIVAAGEGALEPLLPAIRARTLLVWGADDRMIHPSSLDVFAAAIPGAEAVLLPGCGHDVPGDCPDELATRYGAFLDGAREEAAVR
jgi:abhydrolase domain-containing protein 6